MKTSFFLLLEVVIDLVNMHMSVGKKEIIEHARGMLFNKRL